MLSDPIVVLKFGGSVLTDAEALVCVVSEIERWLAQGWRVVGVVSALGGRTDALVASCDASALPIGAHTKAGVLALGERESSAMLALRLEEAGIQSAALTPGGVRMRAEGDPLDATPTGVDVHALLRALERRVVVFPGFVALDGEGRTVTLGRGGSDLTALFLADALGARVCRLVKDVDALYERDPTSPGPTPRRYARATYADALATDGSIVQYKAVRFARERDVVFELGSLASTSPTRIGCAHTRFAAPAVVRR